MPQPKSKRSREEINQNEVLQELRILRDEFRKENKNFLLRDFGIVLFTFGALLTTVSFSFAQFNLTDLFKKASWAGFFLLLSGLLFILASFGPFKKPSRESLHRAFNAAKNPTIASVLCFLGLVLAIVSVVILII